jgi:hypothetical protein
MISRRPDRRTHQLCVLGQAEMAESLRCDGGRRAHPPQRTTQLCGAEPTGPANRPSCCDGHDAMVWPAGPEVAACSSPCPGERFMRRPPGWNGPGPAIRPGHAHFRRARSPSGMSGRAAQPPLQTAPARSGPGRGPGPARRGDREHPDPRRRPLLIQAGAGPVRARRGDQAGPPALPPRPGPGHITSARPGKHHLR